MTKRKVLQNPKKNSFPSFERKSDAMFLISTAAGAVVGNLLAPGFGGLLVGGLLGGTIAASGIKEKNMPRIPVFYSFHFDNDVMRVQQVRNIGAIDGNSPASPNEWEQLKRTGKSAVENWIDGNMKYKRCVIVLIGEETYDRPWIQYEIQKAWNEHRALLGIHIHNLKCPRNGTSRRGQNPFDEFQFADGRKLSAVVPCYDPEPSNAYMDISNNISAWINHAITHKAN